MRAQLNYPRYSNKIAKQQSLGRLKRLLDGIQKGYFELYKLSEEDREFLKNIRGQIEEFNDRELFEGNVDTEEAQEAIDKCLTRREIEGEEKETLLECYRGIVEFAKSSFDGFGDYADYRDNRDIAENIVNEIEKSQNEAPEERIEKFIIQLERGRSIAYIFRYMWRNWGSGHSYPRIHDVVESMAQDGKVHTERSGRRKLVYPVIQQREWKKYREGKENVFVGSIERNITDYFKTDKNPTVQVHEFFKDEEFRSEEVSDNVYVVAKRALPLEDEITSIGIYFPDNLRMTMNERYDYRLKTGHDELVGEDAQVAILVKHNGEPAYKAPNSDRPGQLLGKESPTTVT